MADFNRAINWLKSGKKVRRPIWNENSYWTLSDDGYGRILYSDGTNANIHLQQLAEKDWEIFSEKALENRDLILTIRKLIKEELDKIDRYL